MNDTKTSAFSLPDTHPAKPLEEMLRATAPQIAAGVYEWLGPRPPRAPLTKRVVLAVADRLTRAGRALRAFVWAYDENTFDLADLLIPPPPSAARNGEAAGETTCAPAPAPSRAAASTPHVNGIGRPPAAEGTCP